MSVLRDTVSPRSPCPIAFGLDLFGDKWSLLVLRDLLFYGKSRFSDFATDEKIAPNILTDRLSRLEHQGFITKQKDQVRKNQNTYSVTPKGTSLLPLLIELSLWGMQNHPRSPISGEFAERLRVDRRKVIQEIDAAVREGMFYEYREQSMGVHLPR